MRDIKKSQKRGKPQGCTLKSDDSNNAATSRLGLEGQEVVPNSGPTDGGTLQERRNLPCSPCQPRA